MFELVFHNSTENKRWGSSFFIKILDKISNNKLRNIDNKKKYSLSIYLVGDSKIKNLNNKYRSKNEITDVLSFPTDNYIEDKSKKYDIIDLGDIFISLSFVKRKFKNKSNIEKQLILLLIHGLLHLIGYDHEKSKKEADDMLNLQNKILNNIKL